MYTGVNAGAASARAGLARLGRGRSLALVPAWLAFDRGPCCASPAAAPAAPIRTTSEATFNLVTAMVLSTSSIKMTTRDEMMPAASPFPAATAVAARTVDSTRALGTAALSALRPRIPLSPLPELIAPSVWPRPRRDQPATQNLSRPRQAALDRSHRPAQVPGCLLVSEALQIAKHYRHAVPLRKPVDLLVEHCREFVPRATFGNHVGLPAAARRSFSRMRAAECRARVATRWATRWSHGPSESRTHSDRACFTRIRNVAWKRVLGIMLVAECVPADAQDHRAVPLDQGCKRKFSRLSAPAGEPLQELTVRQLPDCPQVEHGAELR